ncbi:hypothetical protein AX17_000423 [Amanita inopinata Kibby_2008]|nr:hypothetical protein AX17_000423 [Amanita inopinata Kibby_2008]
MILLTPTEENGKPYRLGISKSLSSLCLTPPPIHPALQYASISATPPNYLQAQRPSTNITYTFVPNMDVPNSMTLNPPSYLEGSHSPFCISVSMNCFTPSSHITTVRRGSHHGELVGDFEQVFTFSSKPPTYLGDGGGRFGTAAAKKPTVCIRGNEYPLNEVIESNHRLFRNVTWCYRIMEPERQVCLYWDEGSSNASIACFSSKNKTVTNLLAKFLPPSHPRKQGRAQEFTRLEVTPHGHDVLDDIVMSALIVERLRTTPSVRAFPGSYFAPR